MGSPLAGASKKEGCGGKRTIIVINVNVSKSKTVGYMAKVTINYYNRKPHMLFRVTPRSMTLDGLELLYGQILSEFRLISRLWEAKTGNK